MQKEEEPLFSPRSFTGEWTDNTSRQKKSSWGEKVSFWCLAAGFGMQTYYNLTCDAEKKQPETNFFIALIVNSAEVLSAYILADLISFAGHYWVDSVNTQELHSTFQKFFIDDHHADPQAVVRNSYSKILTPYYGVANMLLLPVTLCCNPSAVTKIWTFTMMITANTQLFHKWSHMNPKDLPAGVEKLQNCGILNSRENHKIHHYGDKEKNIEKFETHFSVISGWWNPPIDWLRRSVKKCPKSL